MKLHDLLDQRRIAHDNKDVSSLQQSMRLPKQQPHHQQQQQQRQQKAFIASHAYAEVDPIKTKVGPVHWTPEQIQFLESHVLSLHPPTSIEHAVCSNMPTRIWAVNTWMGRVFGSLRIATWAPLACDAVVASVSASASASAASSSAAVPARIVAKRAHILLQFHYDIAVLNCVRRMWNGMGQIQGIVAVMEPWLYPLLKRASIYYGGPVPVELLQRSCFVGMTILPPCVLTRIPSDAPPPTVVAHIRGRREHSMAGSTRAWSTVDSVRLVNLVSGL